MRTVIYQTQAPMKGKHYKKVQSSSESDNDNVVLLNPLTEPTDKPRAIHRVTLESNMWNKHSREQPVWATCTDTKQRFPLQMETHSSSQNNKKVLIFRDEHGQPCAVLVKSPTSESIEKLQLFGFQPLFANQPPKWKFPAQYDTPVNQNNNDSSSSSNSSKSNGGRLLYKYASLELDSYSTKTFVLEMQDGQAYRAQRRGVRKRTGKPRLVGPKPGLLEFEITKQRATTSGYVWDRCAGLQLDATRSSSSGGAWELAVGPGTDPSLMIAFCAMLDVVAVKQCNARHANMSPYHKKRLDAVTETSSSSVSESDDEEEIAVPPQTE